MIVGNSCYKPGLGTLIQLAQTWAKQQCNYKQQEFQTQANIDYEFLKLTVFP